MIYNPLNISSLMRNYPKEDAFNLTIFIRFYKPIKQFAISLCHENPYPWCILCRLYHFG
jgi:hypothetical protein